MSLPIPAGRYEIDTGHSQLGFGIRHLGISTVRGTFDSYRGSLTIGEDLASTAVEVEADVKSLNSGNSLRDGHLLGVDFFDQENFPSLSFRSTSISEDGDGYRLDGELTVRGVTKPVSFSVTFNGSALFPMDGSTHFGFGADAVINRTDFGVSYGVSLAADRVDVHLECQFVHPAPPAG
jgi:polyisoprenoid-binding protein YceI